MNGKKREKAKKKRQSEQADFAETVGGNFKFSHPSTSLSFGDLPEKALKLLIGYLDLQSRRSLRGVSRATRALLSKHREVAVEVVEELAIVLHPNNPSALAFHAGGDKLVNSMRNMMYMPHMMFGGRMPASGARRGVRVHVRCAGEEAWVDSPGDEWQTQCVDRGVYPTRMARYLLCIAVKCGAMINRLTYRVADAGQIYAINGYLLPSLLRQMAGMMPRLRHIHLYNNVIFAEHKFYETNRPLIAQPVSIRAMEDSRTLDFSRRLEVAAVGIAIRELAMFANIHTFQFNTDLMQLVRFDEMGRLMKMFKVRPRRIVLEARLNNLEGIPTLSQCCEHIDLTIDIERAFVVDEEDEQPGAREQRAEVAKARKHWTAIRNMGNLEVRNVQLGDEDDVRFWAGVFNGMRFARLAVSVMVRGWEEQRVRDEDTAHTLALALHRAITGEASVETLAWTKKRAAWYWD